MSEQQTIDTAKKADLSGVIWLPQLIATVLLVWALNPDNPYSYYILLRWVCCATFAYLALKASEGQKHNWLFIFGITAILYNPVMTVHLEREIWCVVNIATIVLALASLFAFTGKSKLS